MQVPGYPDLTAVTPNNLILTQIVPSYIYAANLQPEV